MKRIGLFGGTFNPPHIGHLLFAQEALHVCELDEIWFIPVNVPPHKTSIDVAPNEDRLDMLRAAIGQTPQFKVNTIEFERKGPSYTIDTVLHLKALYPDYMFFFLLGGDMIDFLPKWERIDELIELVTFIGVSRPGSLAASEYSKNVTLISMTEVGFSSTEIRNRVRERKPITYMVPSGVEVLIKERSLYET